MPPQNTLKQRIRDGEIVVALRLPIDIERKQLEFALSKGDYPLLYIDGQHSAYSDAQIVSFCAMAEDLGLPVQLRIPHTRLAYLIGRYLDLGLSSVMVPEVVDEATVDEAIAYAYYPQFGRRSWGGDARYGLKNWEGPLERVAHAKWWNEHVVLGIQFESVDAISNARTLAKPGVDYIAFGPNDLLFSLEGHPHYPLQNVDDCMRNVAEQVQGTGVRLGMHVTTEPDERDKFLDMGITVFQEVPQFA
jgi:2-keto-3-deoxy-L-rhamnonate aldolase RhmA